jgi:hypothetical protein
MKIHGSPYPNKHGKWKQREIVKFSSFSISFPITSFIVFPTLDWYSKRELVKIFWLNIWMNGSKCMVNQFLTLVLIKVNIKKHHPSSTELITCTTSSTNLLYFGIWCSKFCEEEKVFQILVSGLKSNGFYIANLALFFMVYI